MAISRNIKSDRGLTPIDVLRAEVRAGLTTVS